MSKTVLKSLFFLFVWGSSLYGYIVAYKKVGITLPAEFRKSAADDGHRVIHFLYDVHLESGCSERRAKLIAEHNDRALKAFDLFCNDMVDNNVAVAQYFEARNLRGMPAALLAEVNFDDLVADYYYAPEVKALSEREDFAGIHAWFAGPLLSYKLNFMPYFCYSCSCSPTKNLAVVPCSMVRSTYMGYARLIGDQFESLTKQTCSEDIKRNIISTCAKLKRILLSGHQAILSQFKSMASQSFLGKNKKIQQWYSERELDASAAKHQVDIMALIVQSIIRDHPSISHMLPDALKMMSPDDQMRYLVLMLCVLNEVYDLTNLGLTREDCSLLKELSSLCATYHQNCIMELFYGDFELLFHLGMALEMYDECFVYAGFWHCHHIADALEHIYGGTLIDQAGYCEVASVADIGDHVLPFSSIQSL